MKTSIFYKATLTLACASIFTLTPFATSLAVGAGSPSAPSEKIQIQWLKWSPEAFAQAKKENKMIILSVGIEVCFACRWMEEFTYQDPRVAKLINQHFVAIQVDADNQPDIGERYSDWAWPATIFMAPDTTQVLALRGNRRPPTFLPLLNTLIDQHTRGKLKADDLAPYAAPAEPEQTPLTGLRNKIRSTLDNDYDDKLAGFDDEYKEIENSGNFVQLLMRAHAEADQLSQKRFLRTAEKMLGRMDKVWGGFFAAGENGWTNPIPEKRAGAQATALDVFANAYFLTQDKRYLQGAKEIDRYMRDWLQSPEGTFYTSQKDLAPNLPRGWTTQRYFALNSDAKRRRYGTPPIDHAVYTDLNSRLIVAYARIYEASGDPHFLQVAIRCAQSLISNRIQTDGWILHNVKDETMGKDSRIHLADSKPIPYLRAQAHFGLALMALQRVTGDSQWLHTAEQLAAAMRANLEDKDIGGFFSALPDKSEQTFSLRKPLQENGVAARFLYQLGKYTKNQELITSAEKAVKIVSVPHMLAREGRIIGELAVAMEMLTQEYVEFSIVGDPKDPQAKSLFEAARAYYEPRKILHYEQPGRYPDLGRVAMYICSPNACSKPIFDKQEMAEQAEKFQKRSTIKSAQR